MRKLILLSAACCVVLAALAEAQEKCSSTCNC